MSDEAGTPPHVSPEIREKLTLAFSRAAARASLNSTMCSRASVADIVDQRHNLLFLAFGGAAYTGRDPAGNGDPEDIFAEVPIAVALAKPAALSLMFALQRALGMKNEGGFIDLTVSDV